MEKIKSNKSLFTVMAIISFVLAEIVIYNLYEMNMLDHIMLVMITFVALLSIYKSFIMSLIITFVIVLAYGVFVILNGSYDHMVSYIYLCVPLLVCLIFNISKKTDHDTNELREQLEFDPDIEAEEIKDTEVLERQDEVENEEDYSEFYTDLEEEISKITSFANRLSLMHIDINAFDVLNKLHGADNNINYVHTFMDIINELTLSTDKLYKINNDSCFLILINTDESGALLLKNKIINNLEVIELIVEDNMGKDDFKIEIDIEFVEYKDFDMDAMAFKNLLKDI